MEAAGDQTHFAEELPFATAVPRTVGSVVAGSAPAAVVPPPRSRLKLLLIGGGVVLAMLLMVTALTLKRGQLQRAQLAPTLAPSVAGAAANPELEKRLQQLESDVANADPVLTPLAFPPINYAYTLEDATARLQRTSR
jgi:hypothetical protein